MILVTGGSGFVGAALLRRLVDDGFQVRASYRGSSATEVLGVQYQQVGDITESTDWSVALSGVDALVHCAARAPAISNREKEAPGYYRQVNVAGTCNLALQAAQAGVRRFVFVSSIKVNGETTNGRQPFTAHDVPAPRDFYGLSKMEAERELRRIETLTGMEVVIIRPPIVYGPGVKANFASMVRWVSRGVPLPLGGIKNARSMVALANLVDLLVTCLHHPAAAGQTFLVSDGKDVSTPELLLRIGQAMGKQTLLLPVPIPLLELGAVIFGKRAMLQRLCSSLQVDMEKTRAQLGWTPPVELEQGLQRAVEGARLEQT